MNLQNWNEIGQDEYVHKDGDVRVFRIGPRDWRTKLRTSACTNTHTSRTKAMDYAERELV